MTTWGTCFLVVLYLFPETLAFIPCEDRVTCGSCVQDTFDLKLSQNETYCFWCLPQKTCFQHIPNQTDSECSDKIIIFDETHLCEELKCAFRSLAASPYSCARFSVAAFGYQ
jgi:hypothetical protein